MTSRAYSNGDTRHKNASLLNHKLRNHVSVITGITISYRLGKTQRTLRTSTFKNHMLPVDHFLCNVGGNAINCKLIYLKNNDIYSHLLILTCLSIVVVQRNTTWRTQRQIQYTVLQVSSLKLTNLMD